VGIRIAREILNRLEHKEDISLEEIIGLLPNCKKEISKIYDVIQDIRGLLYLVGVIDFFNNEKEAAKLILEYINIDSFKEIDFKEFYYRHEEAYKRRCRYGVFHNLNILRCSLDSLVYDLKNTCLGCGSPNYVVDPGDDPTWHNVIRSLEDHP